MTGRKEHMRTLAQLAASYQSGLPVNLGPTHTPIYHPRKHTVESYRSQQRKAKKRKKQRARMSKRKSNH